MPNQKLSSSLKLLPRVGKKVWKIVCCLLKVTTAKTTSWWCPFFSSFVFSKRFLIHLFSFQILVFIAQFSGLPAQLHEVHHFLAPPSLPFHPDFCSFGHAIVRWNFQFPWRNTSFEFQLLFHCHAHRLSGQFFFYFSHHFSELLVLDF